MICTIGYRTPGRTRWPSITVFLLIYETAISLTIWKSTATPAGEGTYDIYTIHTLPLLRLSRKYQYSIPCTPQHHCNPTTRGDVLQIEVAHFGWNIFWITGLLNPTSSEFHFTLRPWDWWSSGMIALHFPPKSVFVSNIGLIKRPPSEKAWCTSTHLHTEACVIGEDELWICVFSLHLYICQ